MLLSHTQFSKPFQYLGRILAGCVLSSGLLFAQVGTFDSTSTGADGALVIKGVLPPIEDLAAVYDTARDELVVFGGQFFSPAIEIDHTYTFDGVSWIRKRPEISPSAREQAKIAFDSVRNIVIIYGGRLITDDCWIWDGENWAQAATPQEGTNFYQYDIEFDAARGETIFVGRREFNSAELETWAFDGANWLQKNPATTLPKQNSIDLIYDESLQEMVLVMRVNSSEFQTWTWNGVDWTQIDTTGIDLDTSYGLFAYDGRTDNTVYLGSEQSYAFNGSGWTPLANVPEEFSFGTKYIVYHNGLNALLSLNGSFRVESGGVREKNETWAWYADGSVERLSAGSYIFDMSEKPDGVWNYTTIDIGPNTVVEFARNENNTPVRWLASGDVNIEGILNLSAQERKDPDLFPYQSGLGGYPGPGGYEGATGGPVGIRLRVPGGGPGGGLYTGAANSANGTITTYSNPWLYPLTGGSGSGSVALGTGGGGGGGSIMIASSGTITHFGEILAIGATQNNSSTGIGGSGAVLLRANNLTGNGSISAGRIRMEGWNRLIENMTLDGDGFGNTYITEGPPLLPVELGQNPPRLWIESINGVLVANPRPSADSQLEVDAFLTGTGTVAIVVKGENVPDNSQISLKISLQDNSILEPEPVTYSGGQAIFNVDLPEGFGAISATATFPWDL